MDCPNATNSVKPREPVLVLCHSDGWTEVYVPRHIDVVIRDVPMTSTPAGELLAEQWIEATIPLKYRQVFWPDCRRAFHVSRIVTADDIAARQWRLEFLRAIQEITPTARRAAS